MSGDMGQVIQMRAEAGPEPYLSRAEIASFMRVSPRTIDRWTLEGMPHETWGLRTKKFRASECVRWARTRSRRAS